LFRHLKRQVSRSKYHAESITAKIKEKFSVINTDDLYAVEFLEASPKKKITYSIKSASVDLQATGSKFTVSGVVFTTKLIGKFNVYNMLASIATVTQLGLTLEDCLKALKNIKPPAGRLERIDEGQNFIVIVDYAPEPHALEATYEALNILKHTRLIHVLGSTGGGRDKSRRQILGQMAGKTADIVIVTNEDPYDEDPVQIINEVAAGAIAVGKKENENLFKILDRRLAIKKAFMFARAGDMVLLTGKGSEQVIAVEGGKKVSWDERSVAREELKLIPPGKQQE
jgi:UDP-N-acetylmuramoyl-L-alanyl-D-glutamate--2,6-diaminopimelate ligase